MTFFDYVNLLKLDRNIEDCNLTLPECDGFAAFLMEVANNHISDDDKVKIQMRYKDYKYAASAYEDYMESLTPEQLAAKTPNIDALEADELWWNVCNALEEMAYYIRYKSAGRKYFMVEG
jgi:hypothetical protein